MKKAYLFAILPFLFVSSVSGGTCPTASCDPSILYAMGKHRDVLRNRIGDLKNTIKQTKNSMVLSNKLCALEAYELLRLKQRKRIEIYKQEEIGHFSNAIKSQTTLITQ